MTRELGRREFIQGAAVVSAGIAVGCGTSSGTSETGGLATGGTTAKKVVVIGGGAAGLAAASAAMDAGYDVILYEASERVGGRVWTRTFANNGPVVDLGVASFCIEHGHVAALVDKYRLPIQVRPMSPSLVFLMSGQRLVGSESELLRSNQMLPQLPPGARGSSINELRAMYDVDKAPQLNVDEFNRWQTLRGTDTYINYLKSKGADESSCAAVTAHLGPRSAVAPAVSYAARPIPESLRAVRYGLLDGMGSLTDAMAASLGSRVVSGTTAISLSPNETDVIVRVRDKNGDSDVLADWVISAIPAPQLVSLLKASGAYEQMPGWELFDAVKMVPQWKAAGTVDQPRWIELGVDGYAISKDDSGDATFYNPTGGRSGNFEVVVNTAHGSTYQQLAALERDGRMTRFQANLGRAFPDSSISVKEYVECDWGNAPNIGGGYAKYGEQGGEYWAEVMAACCNLHGRLALAGDWTLTEQSLDSAIKSGERATRLIQGLSS